MDKKELRNEILKLRNELTLEERNEKSNRIAKRIIEMNEFQTSNVVLLYNEIRSEVETAEIAESAKRLGKRIYVPRVIGEKMDFYLADDMTEYETSRFGIREPKMEDKRSYIPNERDSIFVAMPGAVYDKKGNRIGYGGGYYDKYLQGLADLRIPSVCKVAIAYECQLVECGLIEKEAHDIKVDYIVTEDFLYKGER